MNKLMIASALALGLMTSAIAQTPAATPQDRAEAREARMAQHIDRLAERLNLTPAQKLEVQGLFEAQRAERRAMAERQRAERRAMKEQGQARLAAVLTAEQMTQLDALRAERGERWREHRGHRRHGRHGCTPAAE